MADNSVVVDDDDESKIVTEFLLDICRLPQPSFYHVYIIALKCILAMTHKEGRPNCPYLISLMTGSSAELYIRPMLPFVGDVDAMTHKSDELAILEGYPPPSELPAEFCSHVRVYEIIDSEYPGYVYVVRSYLLTKDSDTGKHNAVPYDERQYVPHVSLDIEGERHGPAYTSGGFFDSVSCIRCLLWPTQAGDWQTRHRNWPDSATVYHVASNGCDVVQVAHPLCRHDEWMNKYQRRLSFSRAEIVLLNSWMPVQQIVYHMLRFFAKTAHWYDRDSSGRKMLSNYHLKTLTLWACEMKPQDWWTNNINVVRICVKLLRIFMEWLKIKICRHYFVSSCNLLYDTVQSDRIISQLMSVTESWLSTWFVNNYLHKCAQRCPDSIYRLFHDVSTSLQLQNAASAIVNWKWNSALSDLEKVSFFAECMVSANVSKYSLTVQSCDCWINELMKINSCLYYYFTAAAFLHVACSIAKHFYPMICWMF